jgi:hypothetical protein
MPDSNPVPTQDSTPVPKTQSPQPEPDADEKLRPAQDINEKDLDKFLKDKDLSTWGELLKGKKIAFNYIVDRRSGGVFFGAEAQIQGDIVGRSQSKLQAGIGEKVGQAVSQVYAADLEKIKEVYVKPACYDDALKILQERHVVILWGRVHMGKWTSALYLLNAQHGETIFELDPAAPIESLDFSGSPEQGYIIDTFSSENAEKITAFQLGRISAQLKKSGGHLVITVDDRIELQRETLTAYIVIWDAIPDVNSILQAHLRWYAKDTATIQKVEKIVAQKDVQDAIGASMLPGEVDRIAQILIEAASDKLTIPEALERFSAQTQNQAERWFAEHESLDDRLFMLSTTVFNGASYQTILDAEKRLRACFPNDDEQKPKATSSIFSSTRTQRIQRMGASLQSGYEDTEFGSSPIDVVELNNPAIQPAILRYVWKEFDHLRDILVIWLNQSVFGAPFDTRIRAAAAVGELSKHDFSYIRREILLPWATDSNSFVRASAAFALGIPAWESDKAPLVLGLLHHWSTISNWRLCWAAGVAYGSLVGLRFPDAALRDLYHIAKTGDLRLLGVLTQSMRNLFNAGENVPEYRKKVLESLSSWTSGKKEIAGLFGLFIFLNIAEFSQVKSDPEGEPWPALLWLIDQDAEIAKQVFVLLSRSLEQKSSRSIALNTINSWLQTVQKDSRLFDNLLHVVKEIIAKEEKGKEGRLKANLQHWNEQPETGQIASKLLTSL